MNKGCGDEFESVEDLAGEKVQRCRGSNLGYVVEEYKGKDDGKIEIV
ncbi:hypothetical protein [Bacillus altitudinis]|nr:hypothetical protein [Bacillus altitudinis]